jgi:hypothetical protein
MPLMWSVDHIAYVVRVTHEMKSFNWRMAHKLNENVMDPIL